VVSKLQPVLRPSVKVVSGGDIAANTLLRTYRPKLIKGRTTDNRWLVDSLGLIDVISSAIALDGSAPLGPAAGVIRPIALNDVVLDKGILGPSVKRQIGVLVGSVPGAVVDDGLRTAGVPALASNPVADVAPLAGVGAVLQVGVCHASTAVVRPERVEVVAVEPEALR